MDETIELVLKARESNEDAFSQLCTIYSPLLSSLCHKYSQMCEGEPDVEDDFLQEAKMAFYKATASYDINSPSTTFGAYAKACVKNRLVSCVRRIKSKKRKRAELEYSCDDSPQDAVVWRELGTKLLALAENTLSPYEKKVFALYVKGSKAAEISKHVGKSEKSVNNAIFRIRSKLKKTVTK